MAHTSAHSENAVVRGRIEMEVAALVIFGSVALWFAEELHGNKL
jgi:hypothetical protein